MLFTVFCVMWRALLCGANCVVVFGGGVMLRCCVVAWFRGCVRWCVVGALVLVRRCVVALVRDCVGAWLRCCVVALLSCRL